MRLFLLALILVASIAAPAHACGTADDDLCKVSLGEYRIALPQGVERPGALLWLHGWGGSANAVIRNNGWTATLAARGLALIAPDGVVTSPERNNNKNWSVNDGTDYARDDVEFLAQVVADAVARHGVDADRVLLGGFSRGGSMVWDVACRRPGLARAYAPVAGAFWEPMFTACRGPVDLFHVHGWTDRVVPLEGRSLRGGTLIQGDVFQSLYILRETNGCTARQPQTGSAEGDIWRRHWSDCEAGRIDLLLHPGGHRVPAGWLAEALDWFEARLAEDCLAEAAAPSCG